MCFTRVDYLNNKEIDQMTPKSNSYLRIGLCEAVTRSISEVLPL